LNERRGGWYLLTGLIIGGLIGILISLVILPVQYSDTEPSSLRNTDKQIFRNLVANSFLIEADTNRALVRLALLKDTNPSEQLISQAQNLVANNENDLQARALALLAAVVNQPGIKITPLAPLVLSGANSEFETTITPTMTPVTRTPFATFVPLATKTLAPTLGAPYILDEQSIICDSAQEKPIIEIYVENAAGVPVSGEKIEISTLDGGIETFYTGMYPEISPGYADYQMVNGMVYALRVGAAGILVSNLSIPTCDASGQSFPGSIKLIFKQP
jgi:hypothetical protein